MMTTAQRVPSFDLLNFRIDGKGKIHFDAAAFIAHRPALTSHLPERTDMDHLELIVCWYVLHREQGGAKNADLDQMLTTTWETPIRASA